jgi:RNA polymerase sigma factor (sigma-70 family)
MNTQIKIYSDSEILFGIKNKDKKIIRYVYINLLPPIKRYIIKNSGNALISEDIFQEALLIIFDKLRKGNLCLTCNFNTYFIAICKKLWYNNLRKKRCSFVDYTSDIENCIVLEKSFELSDTSEFTILFFKHFNRMSIKSRQVLTLYFKNVPAEVIATRLGFKNKEYAISRKYKCLKRLITSIKSDPELNDIAIEDERFELF